MQGDASLRGRREGGADDDAGDETEDDPRLESGDRARTPRRRAPAAGSPGANRRRAFESGMVRRRNSSSRTQPSATSRANASRIEPRMRRLPPGSSPKRGSTNAEMMLATTTPTIASGQPFSFSSAGRQRALGRARFWVHQVEKRSVPCSAAVLSRCVGNATRSTSTTANPIAHRMLPGRAEAATVGRVLRVPGSSTPDDRVATTRLARGAAAVEHAGVAARDGAGDRCR